MNEQGLLVVCLGRARPAASTEGGGPSRGRTEQPPGAVKYRDGTEQPPGSAPHRLFVCPAWSPHLAMFKAPPGSPVLDQAATQPALTPQRTCRQRDASRQEDETRGPRVRETHTDPNMWEDGEGDRDTDVVPRPRREDPDVRSEWRRGRPDLQQGLVGKGVALWREDAAPRAPASTSTL